MAATTGQVPVTPPHLRNNGFFDHHVSDEEAVDDNHVVHHGSSVSADADDVPETPSQTRRLIEEYLEETDRRLIHTKELGQTLLKQREGLVKRLDEVQQQEKEAQVPADLRAQLAEIEKEHADVGREVARTLVIPKARQDDGPESTVFTSRATASPTKVSAPNRHKRDQSAKRNGDLQFAADISTSLLAQVRQLQAAVAERDETIRRAQAERETLDHDLLVHTQRVRALGDNEQKYKDENWNLETQNHELQTSLKEVQDKEKKLNTNLKSIVAERNKLQTDMEDLKQAHATLADEHASTRRTHDAELHTLKRDVDVVERERRALQDRIDELLAQNQELARAMHTRQRLDRTSEEGEHDLNRSEARDPLRTPEDSPPPSPTKATPRHGVLEHETLRSSLLHAQRQIQNLRSNIHREKTEKIELRRMLQEAREDVQQRRDSDPGAAAKRQKVKSDVLKKPARPDMLGGSRRTKTNVELEDDDWVDNYDRASHVQHSSSQIRLPGVGLGITEQNDTDHTANETEHFDTADERHNTTESEAFMTGVESLAGESTDELTETEDTASRSQRVQSGRTERPLLSGRTVGDRSSYLSTASTSADEREEYPGLAQSTFPKFKLRSDRQSFTPYSRTSRDGTPEITRSMLSHQQSSPATVVGEQSPWAGEQSLFAELGGLSQINSRETTPARFSIASEHFTPDVSYSSSKSAAASSPGPVKAVMMDIGTMTEPWEPVTTTAATRAAKRLSLEDQSSATLSTEVDTPKQTVAGSAAGSPSSPVSDAAPTRDTNLVGDPEESEESARFVGQAAQRASTVSEHKPRSISHLLDPTSAGDRASAFVPQTPRQMHDNATQYSPDRNTTSTMAPQASGADIAVDPNIVPAYGFSGLLVQQSEPTLAADPPSAVTDRAFSPIWMQTVQPITPTRSWAARATKTPERDQPMIPQHPPNNREVPATDPAIILTPGNTKRHKSAGPLIYEDATREVPQTMGSTTTTTDSPLKDISGNANLIDSESVRRMKVHEAVTSGGQDVRVLPTPADTDDVFQTKRTLDTESAMATSPTRYPARSSSRPRDITPIAETGQYEIPSTQSTRPSSASSGRAPSLSFAPHPPLPSDHRNVIARANSQALSPSRQAYPSSRSAGLMGPPTMPASALRRSRTPVDSVRSTTRSSRHSALGRERDAMGSRLSRQSSVSSFVSELDERFNIKPSSSAVGNGLETAPGTDPRMIQAITQTMIGEFLWKYTRKTGSKEMSSTRHRRYFWVHPYTKTLYWSDRDPQSAGASELKAKSVAIESVRVVTDDNPMPPGLHRQSLEITTPGRKIKFTASTSQRHETWFNALSYLLHRGASPDYSGTYAPNGSAITHDDLAEFSVNGYGAHLTPSNHRTSLSSYNSRTTHNTAYRTRQSLPAGATLGSRTSRTDTMVRNDGTLRRARTDIPRVADNDRAIRGSSSISRIRGVLGSIRNKSDVAVDHTGSGANFQQSENGNVHGSNVIDHEQAEAGADGMHYTGTQPGLEDVRACCDGKQILKRRTI